MRNKISDILRNLSVDWDQISNYQDQWIKAEFHFDYLNYKGREIKLEDVLNMIMDIINKGGNKNHESLP